MLAQHKVIVTGLEKEMDTDISMIMLSVSK
jgi:hypothetical protein